MAAMRSCGIGNLGDAPLSLQQGDAGVGLIPGKMFDGFEQFGVFLPHDLVELGGSHSGVLQLLEGFSRVYGLMLACVADEQNAIMGA